ncbi:MAG: carbohydrate ABC transporter permease [Candidatus Gastranaerophilales bacterium]|nr:carbohydrate ABC transporter permease [Candidatus Gastranaerophilales bacterium]
MAKINKNFFKIIAYIILLSGCTMMIFPFFWMLATSLMTEGQIYSFPPELIPNPLVKSNYIEVYKSIPVVKYFFNSLFVASVTTLGQIIIASMSGYAFARMDFKFKEPLFLLVLMTMMIPPQVNIIPLFFVMKELHWIDTMQALIVPGFFGGFGVFLMRQWFKSLPKGLEESAKIDGCNPFQIFFKIALPLALPAVATLSIFTFITTWNSFMWPLIVTNSDNIRTLPVALASFSGSFRETTQWGQLMACAFITTLPAVVIFLLGQKYFINGILEGGMKE